MLNPCPNRVTCGEEVLTNYTAEAPDRAIFLSTYYVGPQGPPNAPTRFGGQTPISTGCDQFAIGSLGQEETDQCAEVHAAECNYGLNNEPFGFAAADNCESDPSNPDPPPPPPTDPDDPTPPTLYGNSPQSCTATCPDGTSFTYAVPTGAYVADSQAQANAIAHSVACQRAHDSIICILTDTNLGSVDVCQDVFLAITASGGTPPYSYSLGGGAPDWMTISSEGVISGRPQSVDANQSSAFTVEASDTKGGTASKEFHITVNPCPTISITPTAAPNGVVGQVYGAIFTASGGSYPYTWSLFSGTIPPGLTLSVNGYLSGTPTTPGEYSFELIATDYCGCGGNQVITMSVGTAGNAIWIGVCPSNPSLTVTIPSNTYVNVGSYAGYNTEQLNSLASAAAIESLTALGCGLCGLTLNLSAGPNQTANIPDCALHVRFDGSGSIANEFLLGPGLVNLKDWLDLITGYSTNGRYRFWISGSTPPPYLFQVYF